WREFGVDAVWMTSYNVLLSYPDGPNMVRLLDASSGDLLAENSPKQKPLYAPEESSDEVPFSFNAYAAPGNVTGAVVYANYGREEDYTYLVDSGIDITGKIVIARYGMIFRANMVSFAEELGAAGVLLYTDPADYALDGPDSVYPQSVMMPPSGTQLGTVKLTDGDPLTPFYPSIESAFHIPEKEAAIPKIPVQPLSYEDAYFVLSSLGGPEAPVSWIGALNLTYRLGPTDPSYVVNMDVHTHNVPAVIHDVIGVIEGAEEPDRYVMLGNHRDAWVFGAIDPSSGTAAMVELARVLSLMRNLTEWRPRRSVVLCSWAAEEYGLVGSMEFTEQFSKQLQDRAVAYLNMDLALVGNYSLKVLAAPMLYDVIWQAAKQVPNPDPVEAAAGRTSVYDTWLARKPDSLDGTRPEMELVGSGSDYRGFMHNQGVTSLDISYNHDESIPGWYPLYHSLYETFALVDELYDQDFLFQSAVTKLWAIVAVSLSDPQVLPFSVLEYSNFISRVQLQISDEFGQLVSDNNRTFGQLLD
ncbi:PA domain, partial [Trinorchestia longiramus]